MGHETASVWIAATPVADPQAGSLPLGPVRSGSGQVDVRVCDLAADADGTPGGRGLLGDGDGTAPAAVSGYVDVDAAELDANAGWWHATPARGAGRTSQASVARKAQSSRRADVRSQRAPRSARSGVRAWAPLGGRLNWVDH